MATKLEMLLSYEPERVRDTWQTLGGSIVTSQNRVFFKNSLFQLNSPGDPLHGYILFVTEDTTVPADFIWTPFIESIEENNYIVNSTNQLLHPSFCWILSSVDLAAITDPYDPLFIPFQESTSDVVLIPDEEYELILSEIGYPFIKDEELEFTKDQILANMILPAIKEYYKWYPIIRIESFPMSSPSFDIPIPDYAFTAVRAFVQNGYPVGATSNPLNRYFDELLVSGPQGIYPVSSGYTGRRRGFLSPDSY